MISEYSDLHILLEFFTYPQGDVNSHCLQMLLIIVLGSFCKNMADFQSGISFTGTTFCVGVYI